MKTVAEQIADWLVGHELNQVFTVTGGGSMFLNYALCNHPKLNATYMHHEQSCSMAAEAYARITNKPAILMTTTGPGAINAFNGVYGAYTDSIPMVVLSGQVMKNTCMNFHNVKLRQLGDQEGPTTEMASHITKYCKLIKSPEQLETELPKAFKKAVSGRPGPVWLDIPIDIQNSQVQLNFVDYEDKEIEIDYAKDLDFVVEKLKSSKKPIVLAGTGVRLANSIPNLLRFIEKHNIPLCTAWTHDIINSDHQLFAGRPGTIGSRSGNFCLQSCDFLLVIGSRLNVRQTGYNFQDFAKNAFVVQVDIDPNELMKPTIKPDLGICLDAKMFVDFLNRIDQLPDYSSWASWCRAINDEYKVIKEHVEHEDKLNPYIIVSKIFSELNDDDVIVCGNASACIIPFQVGELKSNQRMFSNSGSASMGYELPASIGASVGTKNRIICFAGDGSIQMNVQELQTLKTLNRNIIIIVLNNQGYLSIKQTHENFFGSVFGANPNSGIEFPNYCKIADAYGIPAYNIDKNNSQILSELLEKSGPLLINIDVDPEQSFSPRMKSRVDADGKFIPTTLGDMFPFLSQEKLKKIEESCNV